MLFNSHSNLVGQHSFLSASKASWLRYDEEKLERAWSSQMAAKEGDAKHQLAAMLIQQRVKLADEQKTLNMYVNDAIDLGMNPEQTLYYSPNAFGTADAIYFRNYCLGVHDLKTGRTPVHMDQLMVYVAYFCLEYHYKPVELQIELRIYQGNRVLKMVPKHTDIVPIMEKIVSFDELITKWRMEAMAA